MVVKAAKPHTQYFRVLPSKMSTNLHMVLSEAVMAGSVANVKFALAKGADPKAKNSGALQLAAEHGHLEIVKLLLPVSDPTAVGSWAIKVAAANGHLEVVRLLLPVSDPAVAGVSAVRYAAANGHLEIVKLLSSQPLTTYSSFVMAAAAENGHLEVVRFILSTSSPKAPKSFALRAAAGCGHLEIVKLLLPLSDLKDDNSLALRYAAQNGHLEILELLLPFSDVGLALEDQQFIHSTGCDLLVSHLSSSQAKEFVGRYPQLNLPRTHAILASEDLRQRPLSSSNSVASRYRA